MMDINEVLLLFSDKKSAGSGIKNEITQNLQLAEESYPPFKDNI